MRIEQKATVNAPRHPVWEYVTEPANYPVFIDGLTRWDVAGDRHKGLGARYRMLIRVGAADVGGLIAERVAAISLNRRFRVSLLNLKRAVEEHAAELARA